jgi:hypothetical protein
MSTRILIASVKSGALFAHCLHSTRYSSYCHMSRVAWLIRRFLWYNDRIYWTFVQVVTRAHKSLSDTLSSSSDWTLHRTILTSNRTVNSSQSCVTSDGQSASLFWCQAPIWGLRPDFYYCQTVAGLLMWGALFDERTGLPLTIAAGLRQRCQSWVRVQRDSWPYFTVLDSRLSQTGGPGPRIYIPQEQGGPVLPLGTGFPFRRLLRLAGLRWSYSNPPSRIPSVTVAFSLYNLGSYHSTENTSVAYQWIYVNPHSKQLLQYRLCCCVRALQASTLLLVAYWLRACLAVRSLGMDLRVKTLTRTRSKFHNIFWWSLCPAHSRK